jgi:hypothetical protein
VGEKVWEVESRKELSNVLRARFGDAKGREQFEHARELVTAWRANAAAKRAAYLVLTEAINGVVSDSWNTHERRNDARDASDQVITALRVFERAYLDLKVIHGVDALDRLLGRGWREGMRVVDPVLKSLVQFQGHVRRLRARLGRSEKRPGRPPTRGRQKTAKVALVGLGMSPRGAEELIRSIGLTKQYRARKTSLRH